METTVKDHEAWLKARYETSPPLRLEEPADYDGEPTYVDSLFASAVADRLYSEPVKRGRGRPRKHPIKG